MAVSIGDTITAAQYNGLQSRIDQVFGVGADEFGYGQTLSSSQVTAVTDTVTAAQMDNLRSDMNKAYKHQTGNDLTIRDIAVGDIIGADKSGTDITSYSPVSSVSVVSGGSGYSGSVTVAFSAPDKVGGTTATGNVVVSGGVITSITMTNNGSGYLNNPTVTLSESPADPADLQAILGAVSEQIFESEDTLGGHNDYLDAMTTIESGKFSIAVAESTTADATTDSRTTDWNSTVDMEFTCTFTSADQRRYFFNSGGEIRMTGSLSSGSGQKDTDWAAMLSNTAAVRFGYNYTTASSGTGSAIGNYDLTGTYQQIFTKSGSGVYAENIYKVEARADSATVIKFKITLADNDTGDRPVPSPPPPYGPLVDELVTGNITFTLGSRRASGSNVSVNAPTFSVTNTFE